MGPRLCSSVSSMSKTMVYFPRSPSACGGTRKSPAAPSAAAAPEWAAAWGMGPRSRGAQRPTHCIQQADLLRKQVNGGVTGGGVSWEERRGGGGIMGSWDPGRAVEERRGGVVQNRIPPLPLGAFGKRGGFGRGFAAARGLPQYNRQPPRMESV